LYSPFSQITYFGKPILTNYKFEGKSEGFTICTHRHPCPRTSHQIRKNSQITLSKGKKEEKNKGDDDDVDEPVDFRSQCCWWYIF